MKKYVILTSLLALTACGGGSGGGHSNTAITNPDNTTNTTNGNGGNSSTPASIVTNFNLPDAVFMTSDYDTLKFDVENGKVVSLTTTDENLNAVKYNHTTDNKFTATNKFYYGLDHDTSDDISNYLHTHGISYSYDIVEDIISDTQLTESQYKEKLIDRNIEMLEQNGVTVNDAVRTMVRAAVNSVSNFDYESAKINSSTFDINSMGHDLGLAYSDFGTYTEDLDYNMGSNHITERSSYAYVGGLKNHEINKPADTAMTFNGTAAIALNRIQETAHDDEAIIDTMISTTNDAKLELANDGKETLTMNFANAETNPWYNMVVDSTGQKSLDVNPAATNNITNDHFKLTNEFNNRYFGPLETTYYGPDTHSAPTEATAVTNVEISNWDWISEEPETLKLIEGSAVFGGKVQH